MAIGLLALAYKIWYHYTAPNIDKQPQTLFLINRFLLAPFVLWFPLRQRPNNDIDNINRKKANKALLAFYICFIIVQVLSLLK